MSLKRSALALLLWAAGASFAAPVASADVVIGRVNPVTGQTTVFTDRLKTTFPDGGQIRQLYAIAIGGKPENGYALVRAGTLADLSCYSELIRLVHEDDDLKLPLQLQYVFSCEEVEDHCGLEEEGLIALCVPTEENTCACKPAFAAGPGPGPRCKKVPTLLWPLLWEDILAISPY